MLDNVTVNAHSSIKIKGKKTIYFDPFKIAEESHDADIVFITHPHYDHYSSEDIKKVSNDNTLVVVPESMINSVKENNVLAVKPNTEINILGLKTFVIRSYNVSKDFHKKDENWVGYLIKQDGKTYYVCGDMDDNIDGRVIKSDVTFVPIGGKYTMNAVEAADFINAQKPKYVVPTHYGCIVGQISDADTFSANVNENIGVVIKIK